MAEQSVGVEIQTSWKHVSISLSRVHVSSEEISEYVEIHSGRGGRANCNDVIKKSWDASTFGDIFEMIEHRVR